MFEKELETKGMQELFKAVTSLKTTREAKKFLRDLCTFAELKAMSERWQVARYVKQGMPYREVARKTGASTATVTRVAHWLHHGMGGYRAMLNRINN